MSCRASGFPEYRLGVLTTLVMCRRSPVFSRSTLRTALTGTVPQQLNEGVDPGTVSVAPLDSQPVGSHQGHRQRSNTGRHPSWIQDRSPTHLLDARRTGTCEPELTSREKPLMASLLPFDEDPVITAGYGVGHGNSHGGNVGNARNVRNVRNVRNEGKLAPTERPPCSSGAFRSYLVRWCPTQPNRAADLRFHLPAGEGGLCPGADGSARG